MSANEWSGSTRREGDLGADLVAFVALAVPWIAASLLPTVAQWQGYHELADQRTLAGVPHAANVLSNLPFLLVGALGLVRLRGAGVRGVAAPYGLLFAGVLLTAFGSAWYHLDPRDATLVWDRVPIALAFAGLVAGTLADRAPRRGLPYAAAFAAVAAATVLAWVVAGNLLPYVAMQASFVGAALVATARLPSRFTHARWLYGAAALYGLGVACEYFDRAIEAAAHGAISGHTLKHLLAALALYVVAEMLRRRRPLSRQ
jgi:hypothetical protein